MKLIRFFPYLLTLAATSACAQLMPTDGMIYSYTNYNSGTNYGFPTNVTFGDSHSGFIASSIGPGSTEIHADNFFGLTDESTQGNCESRINFQLSYDTPVRISTTASSGVGYTCYLRDENYNVVYSFDGWGDMVTDVPMTAGNYMIEFLSSTDFWSGTSYATSTLDATAIYRLAQASSYTVLSGQEVMGGLESLYRSDDDRLGVFPDEVTLAAEVELTATSPNLTPGELVFKFEGSAERQGLSQTIRLYNYSLGRFDVVSGLVSATEDASVEVNLGSGSSAYVGPAGALKARVRWQPINDEDPSQDGWLHAIDVANWIVR